MAAQPSPQFVFNGPFVFVNTVEGAHSINVPNIVQELLRAQSSGQLRGDSGHRPSGTEQDAQLGANNNEDGVALHSPRREIRHQERAPTRRANSTSAARAAPAVLAPAVVAPAAAAPAAGAPAVVPPAVAVPAVVPPSAPAPAVAVPAVAPPAAAAPAVSARRAHSQASSRRQPAVESDRRQTTTAARRPCPQLFTGDPTQGSRTLTPQGKSWIIDLYKIMLKKAANDSSGSLSVEDVYNLVCKANAVAYLDTRHHGAVFNTFKTVYCHHLNRELFADVEERIIGKRFAQNIKPTSEDLRQVGKKMGIRSASMERTASQLAGHKRNGDQRGSRGSGSGNDSDSYSDMSDNERAFKRQGTSRGRVPSQEPRRRVRPRQREKF